MAKKITRREMLRMLGAGAGATLLAACQPKTVVVEKEKVVTQVVKETVVVEGESKEVTRVVEKVVTAVLPPKPEGDFNVWFFGSWQQETNVAFGEVFHDWGEQAHVDVDFQVVQTGLGEKVSAALAAGDPPEVHTASPAYWHKLDEALDLSPLFDVIQDQGGGLFDICVKGMTFDGKQYGANYGIDTWPMHVRTDLFEEVGGYPDTWDKFNEVAPQVQDPPKLHAFGAPLGVGDSDHMNTMMSVIWSFGGRLCDEEGVPDLASEGTAEALQMLAYQFNDLKIIPPDTLASTTSAWNNEAYQSKRVACTINATSIYAWVSANDPELLTVTSLEAPPGGPAGRFGLATVGSTWVALKKAKLADYAVDALEYFFEPQRYYDTIAAVKGRWVPVYKEFTQTDEFWQDPTWAGLVKLAEGARTLTYPMAEVAWTGSFTSQAVLADAVGKVIKGDLSAEDAVEQAQEQAMEIYQEFA
jgi:ABC-type glycerol-3-phosphate transport system substrate-binding protein